MKIRLCTEADIDAVNAIYNYEIENGVATFDTVIRSKDKAITWFNSHNTSNHPIFVAVDDNDKVLAYCSLSQYRDKDAFDTTVEISIYVDLLARRQGDCKNSMQPYYRLCYFGAFRYSQYCLCHYF